MSRVVAPPYDVITPEDQQRYYRRDPRNVVRLIAGEVKASDHPGDSKYTRAAAFFRDWLSTGVLRRESNPCFYIYQQTFPDPASGERLARTGILCVVELEPFGTGVLAHERTHARPKADRLSLTQAVGANLSPVFALYRDPGGTVKRIISGAMTNPPRLQIHTDGVEEHTIWCRASGGDFGLLAEAFARSLLYIADGHHRYETALNFRDKQRAAHPEAPPNAAFNYVLTLLVDAEDSNLRILPTHRVLHEVEGFDGRALLDRLDKRGVVTRQPDLQRLVDWLRRDAPGAHRFGVVLAGPQFAGLQIARANGSDAVSRLDVSVLHREVLEQELHLHEGELESERHLTYTRDADRAVRQVAKGVAQAAFLLRPPAVSDVLAVASSGAVMPQKSTHFYPKPLSGIVFNPLDPGIRIGLE